MKLLIAATIQPLNMETLHINIQSSKAQSIDNQ